MTTEKLWAPNHGKPELAFRSSGYSFETSVSIVIGDPVDAMAREILVRLIATRANHFDIAIWDDGCGMNEAGPNEALRFGADVFNELDCLGKFGPGRKLASLSRARSF